MLLTLVILSVNEAHLAILSTDLAGSMLEVGRELFCMVFLEPAAGVTKSGWGELV